MNHRWKQFFFNIGTVPQWAKEINHYKDNLVRSSLSGQIFQYEKVKSFKRNLNTKDESFESFILFFYYTYSQYLKFKLLILVLLTRKIHLLKWKYKKKSILSIDFTKFMGPGNDYFGIYWHFFCSLYIYSDTFQKERCHLLYNYFLGYHVFHPSLKLGFPLLNPPFTDIFLSFQFKMPNLSIDGFICLCCEGRIMQDALISLHIS